LVILITTGWGLDLIQDFIEAAGFATAAGGGLIEASSLVGESRSGRWFRLKKLFINPQVSPTRPCTSMSSPSSLLLWEES